MSAEDEQLENSRKSIDSMDEIIINETFSEAVLEISDDDDDFIDISHIIVAASEEDNDDLRIFFKAEKDDTVQNSTEAVDNCRNGNVECGSVNQNPLARGKNLKRAHAVSSRSLKKQPTKISKVSIQNNKFQAASDIIVLGDLSDSTDSEISIKNELPESSCSSIKSESESPLSFLNVQTSMGTVNESSNNQTRKYDYDLSRINWLRPLKNLSSPPHLQIVIIDRNHPLWRISNDKWLMIEKKLLEYLHDEMLRKDDNSIGIFDGAKWTKGIKVVGCGNQNSLAFITQFIRNNDNLWPGANLDVIPINQIRRHIVKVFIPPPELSKTTILSFIKLQNPLIYCDDWEIIRERKHLDGNGGRQLWISINTDSHEYIRRSNGEIKFGINRIWFTPSQ